MVMVSSSQSRVPEDNWAAPGVSVTSANMHLPDFSACNPSSKTACSTPREVPVQLEFLESKLISSPELPGPL